MESSKIVLGTKGIKKVLKGFSAVEAIAEYVWNGYDATASIVEVNVECNFIDGIESICIKDNGYGIDYATLETKFKPFYESNKMINRDNEDSNSSFHGKNGVGRLTFFTFANRACWITVYENNGKKYKYSIEILKDKLDGYDASEPEEVSNDVELGTQVCFSGIIEDLQLNEIIDHLRIDLSWYLELMKKNNYQLLINGEKLDYSNLLKECEEKFYNFDGVDFEVEYCRWSQKLHREYSKYYYLDSSNKEKFKENTTLNNKGDDFYHSVFVYSKLFDDFSFEKTNNQARLVLVGKNRDDDAFKFIKNEIDKLIKEKRNPFIKKNTQSFLKKIEKKEAYPHYNENSFVDRYKKQCLDEMISTIYYIEPRLLGSLKDNQLKTMIKMFALLLESGEIDSFIKIMESVIEMSKDERDDLAALLEFTSMSSITKTIQLLKDRAQSVVNLKKLVFDQSIGAGEINAIQPFIEKNYWLFGEQYHLVTAEEPDFEEALRRFVWILRGEKNAKGSMKINSENVKKQMDIFAVQQMKNGKFKKSVIIELKHPRINLSMKELTQVKTYMATICEEERFNAPNIEWEFYLVGNEYNKDIKREIQNAKDHGESSLVYKVDNYKIYVKTWCEVFTEFEINYEFLMEKLELEQKKLIENAGNSKEEILRQEEKSTARMPEEIAVGKEEGA
jgi:hypothetical protein